MLATYTSLTGSSFAAPLPTVPAGYTLNYAYEGNKIALVQSTSPYDTWATAKGLTVLNNGKAQDPDDDGRNNLQEFAFDGDPLSANNDGKVVGKVATIGSDQVLTLTLPVRAGAVFSDDSGDEVTAGAVDGVVYRIEADKSLSPFGDNVSEVTGVDASTIQAGLPALSSGWTYRTFRAPDTLATEPKAFLRAKISE